MSTIDDALVARAATVPGLTGLIGTQPNMRLYPVDTASQNAARPYVTFQQISGPPEHAMGADPGMVRARYQFDCWADTSTDALTLSDQVRAAFSRFRGTLLGVEILDILVADRRDMGRDADSRYYRRMVELFVYHRE